MATRFSFGSKLRVFGQAAQLTFSSASKGNYDGVITFYGEGLAIDNVIQDLWKKVGGSLNFPFPNFNTRLKTLDVQLVENELGSLFLIHLLLDNFHVSVYFSKNSKDDDSAQIISIAAANPVKIDRLPGVDINFSSPIVMDFVFHIASENTTIQLGDGKSKSFKKGFSYDLNLQLPDSKSEINTFTFDIPASEQAEKTTNISSDLAVKSSSPLAIPSTLWYNLNKKIGPATLYRIGLQFKDGQIWVMLHIDFNFQKLVLALKGLKMGLEVNDLEKTPDFGLEGIGIAYHNSIFGIVGFLLKEEKQKDYVGSITIKSKHFSIFGAGAYGKIDGHNSVFIYSIIDYPLGGLPSFYVNGLALGFGYNRQAIAPPIEQLSEFPLVSQALGKSPAITQGELLEQLSTNLSKAFPPSYQNLFLAIGIKFTTFKIFDAFLLLLVRFGEPTKIDLLGIGTFSLPPYVKNPQIYIEVVMKTSIIPDSGVVQIKGAISPNSYILSKKAQLSGGFAFYFWYQNNEVNETKAGDFVMTMGGYHPSFNKPAHYPEIPRIALTWYVNDNFYLKANAYFALTPAALMFGGQMKAIWNSNRFKAAFSFDMDVLAQWKPFYYEFTTHISVQLEFKTSILGIKKVVNMDVGADLEIWGPEFSGRASIDVKVFGLNFDFGLNFGSKQQIERKTTWLDFQEAFLPEANKILSINILDGLVSRDKTNILQVNPKDLTLRLESAIPVTSLDVGEEETGQEIGIYPMRLDQVVSKMSIEFSDPDIDFTIEDFIYKNVPNALWNNKNEVNLNTPPLIEDALSGLILKVVAPNSKEEAININTNNIEYQLIESAHTWAWEEEENLEHFENLPTFDVNSITNGYTGSFDTFSLNETDSYLMRSHITEVSSL